MNHYETIYYPENFPDYRRRRCQVVPFRDEAEAKVYLRDNGFVHCPVHAAWAVPGTITEVHGQRRRVVPTHHEISGAVTGWALMDPERTV